MVTELFGPVEEDGKASYVAASTADEGMQVAAAAATATAVNTVAATTVTDSLPAVVPSSDPATDGSVV